MTRTNSENSKKFGETAEDLERLKSDYFTHPLLKNLITSESTKVTNFKLHTLSVGDVTYSHGKFEANPM